MRAPHAPRSFRRPLLVGALVLLGAAGATPAFAQSDIDRATARQLGMDGQKALDAKDYKTAEDDFRRADSLVHAPTLLLGLARALAAQGKVVEAQEKYKRIIREGVAPGAPPVFQKAVDDANAEVGSVSPRVGEITITVKASAGGDVPGVQVTVDGTAVNAAALGIKRPADPGQHVLHATAAGYKPVDLSVTVPEGGSVNAPLTMEVDANAAAAPTPSPTPAPGGTASTTPQPVPPDQTPSKGFGPWPWVALGVGGAGIVVGAVAGGLALGKHSTLSSNCSGGTCPPSEKSDLDSYNTLGTVSTVGFIVGGIGAAAGVTMLLLQPKSDGAPPATGLYVTPVVGLGSVGAVGRF
jgi:hypothetical protein